MPLTRDFKETVQARARRDPRFRRALLIEAIDAMLSDEIDVGRSMLRDYINATTGFATLQKETQIPEKSLMRMFGPSGNPRANNLFQILGVLQRHERVNLHLAPLGRRTVAQKSGTIRRATERRAKVAA